LRWPAYAPVEVREQVRTLGPGGGFVFNTIGGIFPEEPVETTTTIVNTR